MSITSNLQPMSLRLNVFKSDFRYMGGEAVCAINSSFNRMSSLSLGYSSNLFLNFMVILVGNYFRKESPIKLPISQANISYKVLGSLPSINKMLTVVIVRIRRLCSFEKG